MLTEGAVRALKSATEPYKQADGKGLLLLVSPNGTTRYAGHAGVADVRVERWRCEGVRRYHCDETRVQGHQLLARG